MHYAQNPYAAPQAPPPAVQGPGAPGEPQPWDVGEVLGLAWERLQQNWPVAVFSWFVVFLLVEAFAIGSNVLQVVSGIDRHSPLFIVVTVVSLCVQMLISTFFNVGLTRIWLALARGGSPSFALLFSGIDRLFPLLGCTVTAGIAVGLGFLAFVVPGVLFVLGLSLSHFYVVDAEMGPISGPSTSWEKTRGQRGALFLLSLAVFGLCILGLLMCGVGMFVTVPLGYIAFAIAFTRISGRGAAQGSEPAAPYPLPPSYGPAPGYGYGGPAPR
jgi:uncharacterized membrane protein